MLITGYVKSTKKEKGGKKAVFCWAVAFILERHPKGCELSSLIVYLMRNKTGQIQPGLTSEPPEAQAQRLSLLITRKMLEQRGDPGP